MTDHERYMELPLWSDAYPDARLIHPYDMYDRIALTKSGERWEDFPRVRCVRAGGVLCSGSPVKIGDEMFVVTTSVPYVTHSFDEAIDKVASNGS